MLRLIDLIRLSGVELADYKIHCATDNKQSGWRPLDFYFAGNFEEGQSQQANKNFECRHVLSLVNLGQSRRWLFVGVYRVDGVRSAGPKKGFVYQLTRIAGLEHLDGRAIIQFEKEFRNSYLIGQNHEARLLVDAILEERMSIADFPGFNAVNLSFETLSTIIRQNNPSWRAGLANVAGVYLVVDRMTGKQYVGSAYGGVGIWQRWSYYTTTGHGGNKELRQLLSHLGKEYAKNFQFTLVEVCDINSSKDFVLSRESHWKNVLMTREFGLNWN